MELYWWSKVYFMSNCTYSELDSGGVRQTSAPGTFVSTFTTAEITLRFVQSVAGSTLVTGGEMPRPVYM